MGFFVKLMALFFFLMLGIRPAVAAVVDTTSMLVGVDVVGDCTISAAPLLFGVYNPNACQSTESTARLKVLCTLNTPYHVALDQGAGYAATTRLRRLSGADATSIRYTLSQNPSHTLNWGNILGVDTKFRLGNGLQQILVVYGQIPPQQKVGVGSYRDVVNVSIIF